MFRILIAISLLFLFGLPACNQQEKTSMPPGYDLNNPERFAMPETLLEISGIAFNQGISDTVYAIQDEEGKLFRLAWGKKKQYHSKFGKSGDYEDLSFLGGYVFILKSNGQLTGFSASETIYVELDSVKEWKKLLPKGEYESMAGDETTGSLYVLCKNCEQDDKKSDISGFILHFDQELSLAGQFEVDVNQIKSFSGKVKRGFRPSGLARNPKTGEWFIISAVNKLLVVTDQKWKVKGAYSLDGNIFYQPEGIAFDQVGNLYISNEGDDISEGNILKFVRKSK